MTTTFAPKKDPAQRAQGHRAALWCAAVAGLFCLLVAAGLTATMVHDKLSNPLNDTRMLDLKAQLLKHPKDEALKETLRDWDQKLRGDFFRRRAAMTHGAWLLLGGAAALVISAKAARVLGKKWPAPGDIAARDAEPARQRARWSVAAAGVGMVALLGLGAWWGQQALHGLPPAKIAVGRPGPGALPPAAWPSETELAKNVPVFRGWGGTGIVPEAAGPAAAWPAKWDGASGAGILWKTPVPLPGPNSPVVWGNRVFVTGADTETREVFCFDAATGQLLWRQPVEGVGGELPEVNPDTGLAAPTVATDGQNVYAIFATGDIAAFDFSGNKLWSRNLGKPVSAYGYAASLTVFDNKAIVQWDVGEDAEKSKSVLLALDGRTGKTVWQTKRPVMNGWASPTVAKVGPTWQILTCGCPWVIGYDAATGAELWRAKLLDGDVAPSPVCVGGIVYIANDRAVMAALKADGRGDITESGVVWKKDDVDMPDLVSPATNGELLWTISASGMIQCFDAKTGEKLWEHDTKRQFQATPVVVGDRLWVLDTKGQMRFLKIGRTYEELGTCELGEMTGATPVFANGKVYLRGKRHLYCIGTK